MEGSSVVSDQETPRGRKRTRNLKEWKQNLQKTKRNKGKEYTSRSTGKKVRERSNFIII